MLSWHYLDRTLDLSRHTLVMGILNATPDSFSDGGKFTLVESALAHAERMIVEGAEIIDIGGESTRPGAEPVGFEEEYRRVVPLVRELAKRSKVLISIDTTKAKIAEACLDAGAQIINDISACRFEPDMVEVVRKYRAGLILMHMQGTPTTMQTKPAYDDVVADVSDFLAQRIRTVTDGGVPFENIAIDPGIGFGKTHEHNMELLANLGEFGSLRRPLCLGVSRKGFIGQITGKPRSDRMAGSLAVACDALSTRSAQILRVHDIAPTVDAVKMIEAIQMVK